MEKEKSLSNRNSRKTTKTIVNNLIELFNSKVNKRYILSENSPDFLKRNRSLILKTIKVNPQYLDRVSDDILLQELIKQELPPDGIIDTAFKREYYMGENSAPVLISEHAKNTILYYIEIQKSMSHNNMGNDELFTISADSIKSRMERLIESLDEKLLQDTEFREKLVDLVIENGYNIGENSPNHLKQIDKLAENYYRRLLENSTYQILSQNILNPELLKNKKFLVNYINLLKQGKVDDETITNSLACNEKCTNTIKNDLELFQIIFENLSPVNLENFFNKFFSDKELEVLFGKEQDLQGKLLKVSQLYSKDNSILQFLNGKLLNEKYKNIPSYKMQLIARNSRFQDRILSLNEPQYSLYSKITQLVSQRTDRWNRFEKNIVENLSDGYYGELINDLYEKEKQGNEISAKELENLTFLLSRQCSSKSMNDTYLTQNYRERGIDEESIKTKETEYSDNVFNITSKKELEYFEEIKELVCDTILTNPSLDDEQLTSSVSKYLGKFNQLSELDRIKLAILQKYYNMDLKEASNIVNNFSNGIDSFPANDDYQASIIEQIKAIKSIFESNDINMLSQIGNLDIIVQTDLSSTTYLIEEIKEMSEQLYKKNLYMPKEDEKVGNTTYDGKSIEVFDANPNFHMIVKRVANENRISKDIWNSIIPDGELRYYTCTSYMTAENLLTLHEAGQIVLGFAQGTDDYSFEAVYEHDVGTPFYGGDDIYEEVFNNFYMTPSELVTNTFGNHNEIVINTLKNDENGKITKMYPDYVIYIKNQSDIEVEGLENDPEWVEAKKAASEFGIPIVVIDKEKVMQSEKIKIANMAEEIKCNPNSNEIPKFLKKVEQYISRYGVESILEYASQETMDYLRKCIEEKRIEEESNIAVPNLKTASEIKQFNNSRQEVLTKQYELKQKNVIDGEER